MNILTALRDPSLFGALPAFRNLTTWRPWLTFLAALYGLPLPPGEEARFCRHTGRSRYAPPAGGWREVACIEMLMEDGLTEAQAKAKALEFLPAWYVLHEALATKARAGASRDLLEAGHEQRRAMVEQLVNAVRRRVEKGAAHTSATVALREALGPVYASP